MLPIISHLGGTTCLPLKHKPGLMRATANPFRVMDTKQSMGSLLGLNGPFLGEEGARRYRPILPHTERPFQPYQLALSQEQPLPVHMQVAAYPSPSTTCSTPDTPPEQMVIDALRN